MAWTMNPRGEAIMNELKCERTFWPGSLLLVFLAAGLFADLALAFNAKVFGIYYFPSFFARTPFYCFHGLNPPLAVLFRLTQLEDKIGRFKCKSLLGNRIVSDKPASGPSFTPSREWHSDVISLKFRPAFHSRILHANVQTWHYSNRWGMLSVRPAGVTSI